MRRALAVAALLSVASLARADASLPAPKGKGDWRGQCAERLEQARDENVRRLQVERRSAGVSRRQKIDVETTLWHELKVEIRPIESRVAGDATAREASDGVTARIDSPDAGLSLTIAPESGPLYPWAADDVDDGFSEHTRRNGLSASVFYFAEDIWKRLRPAVDDCLSRATLK